MNGSLSRADIDKELVKANVFSAIDYYHTVRPHLEENPLLFILVVLQPRLFIATTWLILFQSPPYMA